MSLPPAISEKAAILAQTEDRLLPLFPPLERAVIVSLKRMIQNEGETASAGTPAAIKEHNEGGSFNADIRSQNA